jgi:hypothetical protein
VTRLHSRGHDQLFGAFEGVDVEPRSEHRLRERDVAHVEQVVAHTLEP